MNTQKAIEILKVHKYGDLNIEPLQRTAILAVLDFAIKAKDKLQTITQLSLEKTRIVEKLEDKLHRRNVQIKFMQQEMRKWQDKVAELTVNP